MGALSLEELYRRYIKPLSAEQRKKLITMTSRELPEESRPNVRRKWAEIAGKSIHPLLGEDAQAWVSRSRAEGDGRLDSIE